MENEFNTIITSLGGTGGSTVFSSSSFQFGIRKAHSISATTEEEFFTRRIGVGHAKGWHPLIIRVSFKQKNDCNSSGINIIRNIPNVQLTPTQLTEQEPNIT